MVLLPVVLKQLRLLSKREPALLHIGTCAALNPLCVVLKDLQCVVPSDGQTWGIMIQRSAL